MWVESESRMINLSLLVSAIVKAKDLTQSALAAEMPLRAQDTSLAQRQRRWLMNERVDEKAIYQPLIKPFVEAMGQATIPLILDTTSAGVDCHLLTVALGYHHRALPLVWRAGEGKRGHTKGKEQIELLNQVLPWLPEAADVIILGDGEFGHVQLLNWLQAYPYHTVSGSLVTPRSYMKVSGLVWTALTRGRVRPYGWRMSISLKPLPSAQSISS